ncbi:MAG: hypothetical protein J5509_06990 [Lachnospiraceae bacterium]|nr:hypothetical protein [Lachnospiraceae bacterium]
MVDIKFESGRVFSIEDDQMAFWIFSDWGALSKMTEEDKRLGLFYAYRSVGGGKAAEGYFKECEGKKLKEMDLQLLEELLFQDVEELGLDYLVSNMAEFFYVLYHARNGLAVPGGPVPWGEF